jgi:hypothetical protein
LDDEKNTINHNKTTIFVNKKLLYLSCILLIISQFAFGSDNTMLADSAVKKIKKSRIKTKTDPEKKDSLLYSKIKTKMGKSKMGKKIYRVFFKDVYNSNTKSQISQIEENPFNEYEGKIIRTIVIKRLNVFGTSVYDTNRVAKTRFEKFSNSLHVSTKESVIRNSFLQFDVGDIINPFVLKDNERLLRQQPFLHDARIYVSPDSLKTNFADILIVTQDTWSVTPIISYSSKQKFGIELNHNNFNGLAHQINIGYKLNKFALKQKNEFLTRYTIPYIKKSLVTAQAELLYLEPIRSLGLRVFRPFLTPNIKYAGAAEVSINYKTIFDKPRGKDSTFNYSVNYYYADLWLGRAFPLFFGNDKLKASSRIIVAGRASKITFTTRPKLTNDTNQTYQNRRTYLFSLGFSNRAYQRDVLIYGFGRTEDVPVGSLAALVGGFENAELGNRKYLGVKIAHGRYLKNNKGYGYALVNLGSYLKNKKAEQGVISVEGNYFSNIINLKTAKIRQFITVNYTAGLRRFKTVEERLDISNEGIRGVRSDSLKGVKKLVFNFETVLFSRANIAGFRIAPYAFIDLGMVNFGEKSLLKGPIYNGFGLGFRLRNENLTFNTIQIRLGIYPNIPNIDTFRLAFGGEQRLAFKDFDISAPEEVRFK